MGGTILQSDPQRWVNGKIVKDGQEVWFEVEKGNGKIWLRIVEKKAMEQNIVADAAAFGNDIRATGHAAVYGINFDTGKSTIKPESAQAIGEIAKLLKADPGLKIHVVGHTDNVGDVDSNIKLSQDRAEAVLQALVRDHGIAAARLRSYGCGHSRPSRPTIPRRAGQEPPGRTGQAIRSIAADRTAAITASAAASAVVQIHVGVGVEAEALVAVGARCVEVPLDARLYRVLAAPSWMAPGA